MPEIHDGLINHFVRGFFDGDGWILIDKNNIPCFGIVSASKDMLESINNIISERSYIKKNKIYDYISYFNFSYKSYTDIIKVSEFLYNQSSIFLIRKRDKFNEVLNKYQNHKNKESKRWN
jgi:intein-encoded DNA endonuclease-like protein